MAIFSARPKAKMAPGTYTPMSQMNQTTQAARVPFTGPSSSGATTAQPPDDIAANPNHIPGVGQGPQQAPRPPQQVNQPGWGGGQVMGGLGNAAAQAGQYDQNGNWLGQHGTHVPGTSIDAGSRRLDNSAVNWGAFAGIQNYLAMLPQGQQAGAAANLRQMGLMGTYNGIPQDQLAGRASMPGYLGIGGSAGSGAGNAGGNPYLGSLQGGANVEGINSYLQNQNANRLSGQMQADQYFGGLPAGVQAVSDVGGRGQYARQRPGGGYDYTNDLSSWGYPQSGAGAGGSGAGFGGQQVGGGTAPSGDYALQGQVQGAIGGILNNPSPFSPTQTQEMRNQATRGTELQARTAQQSAAEDAARRGLNPAEAQANQLAIAGQYNNQRQQALTGFDLQNAQATRQNLLQGIGAGQQNIGGQMADEDSIRRYLAMLNSAQGGQAPMFLNL